MAEAWKDITLKPPEGWTQKAMRRVLDTWLGIQNDDHARISYTDKLKLVSTATGFTVKKIVSLLSTEQAVWFIMERVIAKDGIKIIDAMQKQYELLNSDSDKVALEASKAILTRAEEIYRLNHKEATSALSDKLKELLEDISRG